jgi:DNA-directed RNA polymerase I and III subunit RPAC1
MNNIAELHHKHISNVSPSDIPFSGASFTTLEQVKENLQIIITSYDDSESEFDIIGVDPSVANALRRILMVEVPSIVVEKVYVHDNTSIMSDAVLSHRLGLIPIKVDPRLFDFRGVNDPPTDLNTIVFNLQVQCTKNPDANPNAILASEKYLNSTGIWRLT